MLHTWEQAVSQVPNLWLIGRPSAGGVSDGIMLTTPIAASAVRSSEMW